MPYQDVPALMPVPPAEPDLALKQLLAEGVTWGDSADWLVALSAGSVDLFFTSPPYADARAYSRIHPDRYAGGIELHREFADEALRRIASDEADVPPGRLVNAAVA